MSKAKLVVLDDEADLAELVCIHAEKAGFDVQTHTDARNFKEHFDNCVDLIILDLIMPGIDGIEIIRFLAEIKCTAQLILMSGFDSGVLNSAKKLAKEHGLNLVGSLNKPFRAAELSQLLSGLSIIPKSQYVQSNTVLETVDELRHAIFHNELIVYYQPKVCLTTAGIPTVESLVRWQHPSRGIILPNAFIPTAEQHGLIDELTWVVINQAMHQCQIWAEQGMEVQIAINMSAQTLKDLEIPEKIEQLLKYYELKPSQITLEITESALIQELITSLDILTRIRMKGFQLSIDDFGTGFSSLVQLYRVPFSEIKVDQSFIFEMENDPEAATIVENIILMGRKLKMKTIAEGVETEYCKKKLTELGCDQAQGYLFAKPMPGDDVFAWFSERFNN